MKVAIVGAGVWPGEITAATIAQKHMLRDFDGDVAVLPQRGPTESFTGRTRNTGAARIKRHAKQRRRRKGK